MKKATDPRRIYRESMQAIAWVPLEKARQDDYDRIGFMSGLEVHQQLDTREKLFCRCPCGIYQDHDDFDAEVIRHMRPTLSELGEYDGTALMEFKTRKEIIYRLKSATTCTYEVDDTPPFPLNRQALEIAIRISLLKKLNIVGEVHITRKQYLDGSIPTGFQRTAIIGVEGEIALRNKKVRLIQLSLEEDSCREVSDVGHTRIYRTDRLGMPLIETVTYPDMKNPHEVAEACQVIRYLNRSTGLVRTGIGAARQDVNVSCRGGTRVEIKGVSHIRWIPALTHIEAFRQFALLHLRDRLRERVKNANEWKIRHRRLDPSAYRFRSRWLNQASEKGHEIHAVLLPRFAGMLAHFTQPGHIFADEISDRLKVIACIEKPNMTHSETLRKAEGEELFLALRRLLDGRSLDAVMIFAGPSEDIPTALETIEERCRMAFEGVPNETRKSRADGTTLFERVLPGADRMYPDTDSAPIPLLQADIERLGRNLPKLPDQIITQLEKWRVPADTYAYILRKNHFALLHKMVEEHGVDPVFAGSMLGHRVRHLENRLSGSAGFKGEMLLRLIEFCTERKLDLEVLRYLLPVLMQHPKMDFDSALQTIGYKKYALSEIMSHCQFLAEKFRLSGRRQNRQALTNWLMGKLRPFALGNISMRQLKEEIEKSTEILITYE